MKFTDTQGVISKFSEYDFSNTLHTFVYNKTNTVFPEYIIYILVKIIHNRSPLHTNNKHVQMTNVTIKWFEKHATVLSDWFN